MVKVAPFELLMILALEIDQVFEWNTYGVVCVCALGTSTRIKRHNE